MVVCWGRGVGIVIIICVNSYFCVSITFVGDNVCKDVGDCDANVII
jgi:hypothetical protein